MLTSCMALCKLSALGAKCRDFVEFGLGGGMTEAAHLLEQVGQGGFFRAADLQSLGISRAIIQQLLKQGHAERVDRGLYRLVEGEISELFSVLAVCKQVPQAIVCLLTALQVHGIGTQMPREVWIGIDRKAWKPKVESAPIRLVRFSGGNLEHGVETRDILGVAVRITSPARTVVDCFRYRKKIGIDVAIEALRIAVADRHASPAEIMQMAGRCRARTVLLPYVEALGT